MPGFLQSRGFWTMLLAWATAAGICLVGDGNCGEAILAAVAATLGYAGVTTARAVRGKPTSYAKKGE